MKDDTISTLAILAAVGVGAFVLVRQVQAARAQPATNSPAAAAAYKRNDANLWGQIGNLLGGASKMFAPADVAARQAAAVAVSGPGASGGYIGDEAVYVPDAAAVNPVGIGSSDFSYGFDQSSGAFWN